MPPSPAPAGPTAAQDPNRQEPPRLGAPGYQGASGSRNGAHPDVGAHPGTAAVKRGGLRTNSPMTSELVQLMEEPPHGDNHGRRASDNPEGDGARRLPLETIEWQAREMMQAGGWLMGHHKRGTVDGVKAHRGVLHPDEHVDAEALQALVEHELGFSYEQVRSVYRQGRLTAQQRELRGRIDARVLALCRAGGNMAALGRALGFPIKDDGHCRVLENALTRARAEDNR